MEYYCYCRGASGGPGLLLLLLHLRLGWLIKAKPSQTKSSQGPAVSKENSFHHCVGGKPYLIGKPYLAGRPYLIGKPCLIGKHKLAGRS